MLPYVDGGFLWHECEIPVSSHARRVFDSEHRKDFVNSVFQLPTESFLGCTVSASRFLHSCAEFQVSGPGRPPLQLIRYSRMLPLWESLIALHHRTSFFAVGGSEVFVGYVDLLIQPNAVESRSEDHYLLESRYLDASLPLFKFSH